MDPLQQLLGEIFSGDSLYPSAAARILSPEHGTAVAPASIKRWGQRGIRLADGRIIRLAMARCGTRLLTSRAALKRFILELTVAGEVAGLNDPLDPPKTCKRRNGGRMKKSRPSVAT